MHHDYDIIVVGGGMIGASLACALSGQGLRIAVLESQSPSSTTHPSYDDRAIALAHGSLRILDALGLAGLKSTPILQIHISEAGCYGFARLHHNDENVDTLGAVTTARQLGVALFQRLQNLSDVELLCPAQLKEFEPQSNHISILIDQSGEARTLSTALLVAADGARSQVREQLGIATWQWDYGQAAIIANVTPERTHQNIAFERFSQFGPMALLPMSDSRCALVYTVASEIAEATMALPDEAFLAQVQNRFGERLGRLGRLGKRSSFPLTSLKARRHYAQRVAVIGNAAHTLHPIAGQGFNLGIRDVASLAEVIVEAKIMGQDIGGQKMLDRYADSRRWDQRRTLLFTDSLVWLFGNPLPPLRWARTLGLTVFNLLPPAKHLLTKHAMGLAEPLPRLARGLPLR